MSELTPHPHDAVIAEQYQQAAQIAARLARGGVATALQKKRLEEQFRYLDKSEESDEAAQKYHLKQHPPANDNPEDASEEEEEEGGGGGGGERERHSLRSQWSDFRLTRRQQKNQEKQILAYRHQKIYGEDALTGTTDSLSERRRERRKSAFEVLSGKKLPSKTREEIMAKTASPFDLSENGRKYVLSDTQKQQHEIRKDLAQITGKKVHEVSDTEVLGARLRLAKEHVSAATKRSKKEADKVMPFIGERGETGDVAVSNRARKAIDKLHSAALVENKKREELQRLDLMLAHHIGSLANTAYDEWQHRLALEAARERAEREEKERLQKQHRSKDVLGKLEADLFTELQYVDDRVGEAIQQELRKRQTGGMMQREEFRALTDDTRSRIIREYLGANATEEEVDDFESKLARFAFSRARARRPRP